MTKYKSKDLQKLVPKLRQKGFYIPQLQRKIDWNIYTTNQINDLIDTLEFIKSEVDKFYIPPIKNKVGRPPTDLGSLTKAILFAELFRLPERKAQGWIKLIGHHMGIKNEIDDRVIGKGYKNPKVILILKQIFKTNIDSDGKLGGDGTGLERSRKENYESIKSKKGLYMTSIVDSREIVQAFDISGTQECQIMHSLVKEIKENIKSAKVSNLKKKLTLDAGFVDRKLTQLIEDSGLTPYIFPKKNLTLKSKNNPAWHKMWLNLLKDVQNWLKEYHIRSHTESFHSSLKRIFGIVTKILDESTYTQVLCRIIHNNRRKLNYFKMAHI
jgi:transposase